MDITTLGIAVDSRQVKEGSRSLEELAKSAQGAESSTKRMGKEVDSTNAHFSKMSGLLRVLATAFAGLQIAQQVKEIALMSARYETMGVVMKVVGNNAGYGAGQMEAFAMGLQKTGIAMIESRAVLTRMAQAQIDLAKSSDLARIAQDAAVIGNINSSEALERMIHGIQSGQIEVLRNIGINVNFEQSYKSIAQQLGKTTAALTETEKMQARVNVVMEAGKGIAGTYEAAMGTAGKQLSSMTRYLDDIKVNIGLAFSPSTTALVSATSSALKDFGEYVKRDDVQQSLRDTAEGLAAIAKAALAISAAVPQAIDLLGLNIIAPAIRFNRDANKFAKSAYDSLAGKIDPNTGLPLGVNLPPNELRSGRDRMDLAMGRGLGWKNTLQPPPGVDVGVPAASKGVDDYAKKLAGLLDRLMPLRAAERDHAESLAMLNGWYAKNKDKTDLFQIALANLDAGLEKVRETVVDAALTDFFGDLDAEFVRSGESIRKYAEAQQQLLDELLPLQTAEREHAQDLAMLEAWYAINTDKVIEYQIALANLNDRLNKVKNSVVDAALDEFFGPLDEIQKKFAKTTTEMTEFQIQAYRNMQDAAADFFFDPFKDGLSGMLDSFLKITQRMVAEWMAAQALMWLFGKDFGTGGALGGVLGSAAGAISGAWNTPGNFLGDLHVASYGGGRASGGPVGPGKFYEVNERGPELLEMGNRQFLMMGNSSGNVVPGGSSSVQVNVINNANGTRATAQERSGSDGGRIIDVFVEQVKGAIASDISRGSGVIPAAMGSTYGLNRVPGAY